MKSHLLLGTLTLLVSAAHTAGSTVQQPLTSASAAAGTPHLQVSGGRTVEERSSDTGKKLDPALGDLALHVRLVRPQSALADLHSMNPAARFMQRATDREPLVLVDAVTRGDPKLLRAVLEGLGLQRAAVFSN